MAEYWNTARTVQMVVAACASLGVDTDAVLDAAGIDPTVVDDPEGKVSLEQMRTFWTEAARRSEDPSIGLHASQQAPHGLYGLIDYLFGYSSTIGEGITMLLRYLPLLNNWIVPTVEVDDDYATVGLDVVWHDIPRTTAEYVLGILVVRGRRVWQVDWSPALIRFEFESPRPPEPIGEHARVYGCGIEYGADATQMIVERSVWDTPVTTADPGLIDLLRQQADDVLARLPNASDFVDEVRTVVRSSLAEPERGVDHVAARLAMSPRTLQRRLAEEETSFAAVVDEVRAETAKLALADPSISLAEIGLLLGFEEQSSFSRAFKRWTGTTPSDHRAALTPRPDEPTNR